MVWNARQTVQSPTWWKRPIVSSASPKHPAISPWEVLNLGEWFRHLSKELRFMFLIGRTSNKALVPSLLLGGECKGNPMNCNFLGKCESFDIRNWKRDHKHDKYDITHYLFTHPIFFGVKRHLSWWFKIIPSYLKSHQKDVRLKWEVFTASFGGQRTWSLVNLHRKKKTCGVIGCWKSKGGKVVTVHGRNPAPVEVGSFSHYLQGFTHSRWCKISSINSTTPGRLTWRLLENHHECFDRRYIDSFIFFVVGFS